MATFGNADVSTNVQTFSGDRIYVSQGTPASSGTVTSGSGRVRITAKGETQARIVIYADTAGEPSTFLAQSDEVTVNWTTSTLTDFAFSGANQISVVGGTPYWIGFWFNDPGTPSFEMRRYNTADLTRYKASAYPATTPTSPLSADGSSAGAINCLITYTEATSGTNIKINIGDTFKTVSAIKINIGDSWKSVTAAKINIGDSWKSIF